MACALELHPLREKIDKMLRDQVTATPLSRWIAEQTPEKPASVYIVNHHKKDCLGLKGGPRIRRDVPESMRPKPAPEDLPSAKLGHDVTDDDIEQRMKKRFYDTIDQMPPEKVADWLIAREKNKLAPAPAKPSKVGEEIVSPDIEEMRAAARRTLGVRGSRTAARARAS